MANVQKFTKGNVKGLSIHLDRKTTNHSNKEIDVERSHLNYDLCEKEGDTLSRMNERLEQVHCLNRADVKVCADWVVTLPESLKAKTDDEQRKFFEKTYEFLTNRYGGEKNVLSANVHNDETTPHLHFAFMPVVFDVKKQREKVSAKEVLNRKDLQTFHQDLDNFLKQEIPEIYQSGILNGETIDVANVKELKKFGDEIKRQKEEMTAELKAFKEPKKVLEKVEQSAKKSLIGDKVNLSSADYEKLKELALSSVKTKHQLDKVKTAAHEKTERLEADLIRTEKRAEQAEKQVEELGELVGKLNEFRKDSIVFKSKLEDAGELVQVSDLEKKGRLIMYNMETGHKPKDVNEGKMWLSILEENKRVGHIPENRLKAFLDALKRFLNKYLGVGQKFDMEAVKRQNERLEKQNSPKRKSSRDMER